MFGYVRRLVRRNFKRIPEPKATKWDRRLRFMYIFFSWNAFGLVLYYFHKQKNNAANNNPNDSLSMSWAKLLNVEKANVYRIDGWSSIRKSRIEGNVEIPLNEEEVTPVEKENA